jgi:transcriptional regulator with XRE-family HTH domain
MSKKLSTYENQMAKRVGVLIREQRETRGVTRHQIAEILGDEYDSIAKKENGARQFSVSDVARLALEWDCPIDLLVFGSERPKLLRRFHVEFSPAIGESGKASIKPAKITKTH